jgi:ribosomal protein S27AE
MTRYLFCPICGQTVEVETDGQFPEVLRLPDHVPKGNAHPTAPVANLCSGTVVTVTLDFDNCSRCGRRMAKHPSELCQTCYGQDFERNRKEALTSDNR